MLQIFRQDALDGKTGILTLVESANDQTFKIWVVSKEKGADGKVILSNYVEVKAERLTHIMRPNNPFCR